MALLHVAAFVVLVRAFAPDFAAEVVERTGSLVTVTVTSPPPDPPDPEPSPEPDAGAAGDEGQRATPREVVAPPISLASPSPTPRATSTGEADTSGARDAGAGTGAGGEGDGMGSGAAGTGTGGGARPLQHLSGTIDDARDYPRAGRAARRGHDVVIELTVGADGRVQNCRVTDPSPDPEADAITCRLATERFVFQPRLNARGEAVVGIYRWRQRWF